ncbi:thiamine phosphate synthase [Methanosphaerula palustris]|uniref:Thiamine-phosphate synthase n=1 Tax=Methanosphaerula palustris (strain ATCC BAA-1556 / DSM 19958 / E1-9c) TaxID=521011 RepID=B8GJF8_METPE|nr:thiamine phosphate synthase [Methanosphaerula palustris]ACL16999.1 thiamine-phosphate pyrophosphorylase [Methanosphaerula palustris E1-9c]
MPYSLYVVTDPDLSLGRSHAEVAALAVAGGADVIQLRDKSASGRDLFAAAELIRTITTSAGALFIVNDRLDIALASGADGVHLGQDDLPVRAARKVAPDLIIGVSVGSVEEGRRAVVDGADYVALSPLFSTPSKIDAGAGRGFDLLAALCDDLTVPVLAIGGINASNVSQVIRAGAAGVAVISAVVSQPDISKATSGLKSIILEAKKSV